MMKKTMIKIFVLMLAIVVGAYTMGSVAYAAMTQIGIGKSEMVSLQENLPVNFHTTLYPRVIENGSVKIENTIQRKNSSGKVVNYDRRYFYASSINNNIHLNYVNSHGSERLHSIWVNQSSNSHISGDWYLDPDHM